MAAAASWLEEVVQIPAPSGELVGVSWEEEARLLVTTGSQVIVFCARTGGRIKEYTFRPGRSLAFSHQTVRIGGTSFLATVQGQSRLALWDQKDVGSPPKLVTAEVPFAIHSLTAANRGGLVWVIGQQGEVAVYQPCASTLQVGTPLALPDVASDRPHHHPPLSALALNEASLLVRKGNVLGGYRFENGQIVPMKPVVLEEAELPVEGAVVTDAGMLLSPAPLSTSSPAVGEPVVWSLYGVGNDEDDHVSSGRCWWVVERVKVVKATAADGKQDGSASYCICVRKGFTRELRPSEVAISNPKSPRGKRRRSSSDGVGGLSAAGWGILGLAPLSMALVQGPDDSAALWDLRHGVALACQANLMGTASSKADAAEKGAAGLTSRLEGRGRLWAAAPGGGPVAMAAQGVGGGQPVVVIWSLVGPGSNLQCGLKGVLGRLLEGKQPQQAPQAVKVVKFRGSRGEGWSHEPVGGPGGDGADALVIMKGLVDKGNGQLGEESGGRRRTKKRRLSELDAVPMHVYGAFLRQALEKPSEEGWSLLGAVLGTPQGALALGDVMRRERPSALEELADQGQWALVNKVLEYKAGVVEVPETVVVAVVEKALRTAMKKKALLALLRLAIARPMCSPFLRAALSTRLDGPSAALLLAALLANFRSKPLDGGAVEWMEALLDCHLVDLVLEGAASKEVRAVMEATQEEATAQVKGVEALEDMVGRIEQLQRPQAPQLQALPDYSLEHWDLL